MRPDDFRKEVTGALTEFAWRQWSQMGLLGYSTGNESRAADPEALLLLSFDLGRYEPRLIDEVGGWLTTNQNVVSVQRLRNLCHDDEDRRLVEAVLRWASGYGFRKAGVNRDRSEYLTPEGYFRETVVPVTEPDPAFLASGFVKPPMSPTGKSVTPDLTRPINIAFRLRKMLGVGVRSEVIRVLWGQAERSMTVRELSEATGYSKRNIQETIHDLADASAIRQDRVAGQIRNSLPVEQWGPLVSPGNGIRAEFENWPKYLHAFRQLQRWLWNVSSMDLSGYALASSASQAYEKLKPDLPSKSDIWDPGRAGDPDYWDRFVASIRISLNVLD